MFWGRGLIDRPDGNHPLDGWDPGGHQLYSPVINALYPIVVHFKLLIPFLASY